MPELSTAVHSGVHLVRRGIGGVRSRAVSVDGQAPQAAVAAIQKATAGRPSAIEQGWLTRIEAMRTVLAGSPTEIQIEDFGAGAGHEFDVTGQVDTLHMVTKTVGAMTASSKPARWAYLLFRLVRELGPNSVIEMGACVGISAAYEAAALEINGAGSLISLEGATVLAQRSQRTLDELDLGARATVRLGQFADTLDEAISDSKPVGFAFIDGHHVEAATVDYAEQLLPNMADESILVFDDINWSEGMRRAWDAIAADTRFALTVDLGSVGIAVVSRSASSRQTLSIPYA